jgi:hypothetical protein
MPAWHIFVILLFILYAIHRTHGGCVCIVTQLVTETIVSILPIPWFIIWGITYAAVTTFCPFEFCSDYGFGVRIVVFLVVAASAARRILH